MNLIQDFKHFHEIVLIIYAADLPDVKPNSLKRRTARG